MDVIAVASMPLLCLFELPKNSDSNQPMPSSPPHPCSSPGCPRLTTARYCQDHADQARQSARDYDAKARKTDPKLAAAALFRSSAAWQKLRRIFLAQHPLCADPFQCHQNQTIPAREPHHIKPLVTHPELALIESNLMAL